jgi:cytochrome c
MRAVALRVTDSTGRFSTAAARIAVGNEPATLRFVTPTPGQPFQFGDTVPYQIEITDDTPADCAGLEVQYVLVHNGHGHSLSTARGCTGVFVAGVDNAQALVAAYTDRPTVAGAPPLSSQVFIPLIPTPPVPTENPDAGSPPDAASP